MRPVFVVGTGITPFGHHWDIPMEILAGKAAIQAMAEAGITHDALDAAYVGHMSQGEMPGQRVLRDLGFRKTPVLNVENACASGASALREAWIAIGAGLAEVALVLGVEKLKQKGLMMFSNPSFEQRMGQVMPGSYALAGQRHMSEYGTRPEDFAWIAVKNHDHGALNPNAMYQKPVSLEEVLGSRMIAEPLTLLQCCAPASGAASVVLASGKALAAMSGKSVQLRAVALASEMNAGTYEEQPFSGVTARAAEQAYNMSGIDPSDIDVVELHDAFTVGELLHYESLQLCPRGEGARLCAERATALGGRIPVNPSGGLLSKGHPTGATGVAQVVELAWQLRGTADRRQVPGAKIGVAQCQGGVGGGVQAAAVSVLSV